MEKQEGHRSWDLKETGEEDLAVLVGAEDANLSKAYTVVGMRIYWMPVWYRLSVRSERIETPRDARYGGDL